MEGVGEAACTRSVRVRGGCPHKRPHLAVAIMGPLHPTCAPLVVTIDWKRLLTFFTVGMPTRALVGVAPNYSFGSSSTAHGPAHVPTYG